MANENEIREQAVQKIMTQTILENANLRIALEMANMEIQRLNALTQSEEKDEEGN